MGRTPGACGAEPSREKKVQVKAEGGERDGDGDGGHADGGHADAHAGSALGSGSGALPVGPGTLGETRKLGRTDGDHMCRPLKGPGA